MSAPEPIAAAFQRLCIAIGEALAEDEYEPARQRILPELVRFEMALASMPSPARNVDRPECRTRDEAWKVFERESAGMWAADWDAAFMAWLFYAAQDEGGSK